MTTISAAADVVALVGAGLLAYAVVVVAAIALCTAARERGRPAHATTALSTAAPYDAPRSAEELVLHVAGLLRADAALFGWDLETDGLRLLAASAPAAAAGDEGRHLAREAVMAGCPARPPALHPVALAVPAERHDVRLGALCVGRRAGPPFTARERAVLVGLGAGAADVLRAQSTAAWPVRQVSA